MTKKKGMPKQGSFGSKPLRDNDEWALTVDGGFLPMDTSDLKGFISTQLREQIEGNDNILVIDGTDSTTEGAKKKKKKKKASRRTEESDKESNASEVLSRSQRPNPKCRRISSERSSVYELPSPKGKDSEEDSGDKIKKLLGERDAVEERLAEMQRKMEGLEWYDKAWQYRETIEESVVCFRVCLINNYGHKEESEDLLDARVALEQNTTTLQQNGFTLTVCEDFVDRVEKTIRSGFIPEHRFTMKVMDNSADDPVQGYVRDVTYCLEIPMVVKWEKAEDERPRDCWGNAGHQEECSRCTKSQDRRKNTTVVSTEMCK